jgi:hypothetical protein
MISVGYVMDEISQSQRIRGISPYDFYVFSVEWSHDMLIWRVNNLEVFRAAKGTIPSVSLFPMFASLVMQQQEGIGSFDIDWIRIYKLKE